MHTLKQDCTFAAQLPGAGGPTDPGRRYARRPAAIPGAAIPGAAFPGAEIPGAVSDDTRNGQQGVYLAIFSPC